MEIAARTDASPVLCRGEDCSPQLLNMILAGYFSIGRLSKGRLLLCFLLDFFGRDAIHHFLLYNMVL